MLTYHITFVLMLLGKALMFHFSPVMGLKFSLGLFFIQCFALDCNSCLLNIKLIYCFHLLIYQCVLRSSQPNQEAFQKKKKIWCLFRFWKVGQATKFSPVPHIRYIFIWDTLLFLDVLALRQVISSTYDILVYKTQENSKLLQTEKYSNNNKIDFPGYQES